MIDGGISVRHTVEVIEATQADMVELSIEESRALDRLVSEQGYGVASSLDPETRVTMLEVTIPVPSITLL